MFNKKNKKYFLVVGLGKSGFSMARFLNSVNEKVVGTDIDPSKTDVGEELRKLGIRTEIGFHSQETFNEAENMIVSTGIPLSNRYIRTALKKGVKITGELDIFSLYNDTPVVAITGTNGKTTTTTLTGEILKSCGMETFVGGNIGIPLVEHLMAGKKAEIVVAEISSFQLDMSENFRPNVGVLLNISRDHLDRYDNFRSYVDSKWSIFKNMTSSDKAVINFSIEDFERIAGKINSPVLEFSSGPSRKTDRGAVIGNDRITVFNGSEKNIIKIETPELPGFHNRENIAAAALASLAAGADIKGVLKGLKNFKNLPHRIEFVRKTNGISFYNDSKGTNTDAVIKAVECFGNNTILILGGEGKKTDFSLLAESVKKRVKSIIAIGETRQDIKKSLGNICRVDMASAMKDAVLLACKNAEKGDTVLLSPACASFDMYKDYADRGNDFVKNVKELGDV